MGNATGDGLPGRALAGKAVYDRGCGRRESSSRGEVQFVFEPGIGVLPALLVQPEMDDGLAGQGRGRTEESIDLFVMPGTPRGGVRLA